MALPDSFLVYRGIKKLLQEIEVARGLSKAEKMIQIPVLQAQFLDLKNKFTTLRAKDHREALSEKESAEQDSTEAVLAYLEEELEQL